MSEFLKTRAIPGLIIINTEILAHDWEESHDIRPLWHAASAAFIVKSEEGPCVIIVRRTGDTEFTQKWALLPSGGSMTVEELQRPSITLERECREELLVWNQGVKVDPLEISKMLPFDEVIIKDEGTGEEFIEHGEVIPSAKQFIFMRAYLMKPKLKDLIIADGEEHYGKPIDRTVAVVKVTDNLYGKVMPVAMFKSKKKIPNSEIDLSGFMTPTLDWFRGYRHRALEVIDNVVF